MFSRNRDDTTRAEPRRGIIPSVHSVLAVRLPGSARQDFFKGTSPQPIGRRRGINISGVDFWHAVEFSRNGRFLCTHPLGLSSGLPFGLAFPTLSDRFRFRFPRCFPGSRFRVSLSGGSDFIRSSESEFPPPGGWPRSTKLAGFPLGRRRKRTGAGRLDANRGAPLPVHSDGCPTVRQTSTTTGRIIGLRRYVSETHLPRVRRTSCCSWWGSTTPSCAERSSTSVTLGITSAKAESSMPEPRAWM